MYLLNLLFDPADTSGQFASTPNATGPLCQSKVWLELVGPDPTDYTNFNPEDPSVSWNVLGRDTSIVIHRGTGSPPFIAVRFAPVTAVDPSSVLQAVVAFGREPRAPQRFASPFTMDNTPRGAICTVFSLQDSTAPAGQIGWYFPLRPIVLAPADNNTQDRYEFTIGAIFDDGVTSYGRDPQMDVSS